MDIEAGLPALFASIARGESEVQDYLGRLEDEAQEPMALMDRIIQLEADKWELLEALQNLHSRDERYDRAERIRILAKYGRLVLPEESGE